MGGDASKTWCATTDNFDRDAQWGECVSTGTGITGSPSTTQSPGSQTQKFYPQTTVAPQTTVGPQTGPQSKK